MNTSKNVFYLLILLSIAIVSCKQGGIDPSNDTFDEAAISEIVQSQDAFTDVFNVADIAMDDKGVRKTNTLCADLDLDLQAGTLLIDFGTTGCTGLDGRTRSGSILIEFQGRFWQPGAVFAYTLTDYTVDGTEIDGKVTLTSFDRNVNGEWFMSFKVENGEVNFPDGSYATYETERVYTWIQGENTPVLDDNVYEVTGFSNGQTSSGQGYDAEIISGLQYKGECFNQHIFYPVAGELRILRNSVSSPYLVDFGTGICDKDIEVDHNGQIRTITLP